MATLSPCAGSTVHVAIDFPIPAIRRQECEVNLFDDSFKDEISRARTFGFEQEIAALHAAGIGQGRIAGERGDHLKRWHPCAERGWVAF